MNIPISIISKFDYFNHVDFILQHTEAMIGEDLLALVINLISECNYCAYLDNKIYTIKLKFTSLSLAKEFIQEIKEYKLAEAFENNQFYSSIQEVLWCMNCKKVIPECRPAQSQNVKCFRPVLNNNEQCVEINIPNNKFLFIKISTLEPAILENLSVSVLKKLALESAAKTMCHHNSILEDMIFLEKKNITGRRMGMFVLENSCLYLVSDIGFYLGTILTDMMNNLYNKNNLDKVLEYTSAHEADWSNFKNQCIQNS